MVTESAPAKINLYLHVKNRRADEYHNLDSLVVFSDFGDSISVEKSDQLKLSVTGLFANFLPKQSGNLVIKAAQKLQEAVGLTKGASIVLVKNLPVASGIGGGSSDAAATLRALSKLWNITISAKKIKKLALTLGADVPVCLNLIPTFLSGIGAGLAPSPPLPSFWLVLVNPGIAVETREIFNNLETIGPRPERFYSAPNTLSDLINLLDVRRNDLETQAKKMFPEINAALVNLANTPNILLARMSGSGATCFGIYENNTAANYAAKLIQVENPNWWVCKTKVTQSKSIEN